METTRFNELRIKVNEFLDNYMEVMYPESVYESMRYSVLADGKRLRPVITIETASIFGCNIEQVMPLACAIEMLHAQSLIHDDLPSMDNDDYRRGKPSNHKVFGESTAILAGDALLSYAPKLIIDKTPSSIPPEIILRVLKEFFIAAGTDGIISGQIVDIDSENKQITPETLDFIYEYKTARLFKLAIRSGAILGGANEDILEKLTKFAQYYGHAFQICDDILDITSTIEELGKTPGKDIKAKKSTYISMFGLEEAKKQVIFLCNQAYDILKESSINSEILSGILTDIVKRVNK